ncbi:MAG: type IX secretion system sortase PorU, partial [Bacteroidota bacterium]
MSRKTLLLLAALAVSLPGMLTAQRNYAEESVLKEGIWYKIPVVAEGIHRLDQSFFNENGISLAGVDPRNLQLYGNGGKMLPQANAVYREDDLVENAIWVEGENDGSFDAGDYIAFYGEGPDSWEFLTDAQVFHAKHNFYSDTNYYFLHLGNTPGLRATPQSDNLTANFSPVKSRNMQVHEIDSENLLASGRHWLGEKFDLVTQRTFSFYAPDVQADGNIRLWASFSARSDVNTRFLLSVGGNSLGSVSLNSVNVSSSETLHYRSKGIQVGVSPDLVAADDSLRITITYDRSGSNRSEGWLDFIEIDYDQNFETSSQSVYYFSVADGVGQGQIADVSVAGGGNQYQIWDITDPARVKSIDFSLNGSNMQFTTETESPRRFVAWRQPTLIPPSGTRQIPNQNLHGMDPVDYLMIVYPGFMAQAQTLAQFHRDQYGRSVALITPDQIFNEFSSGRMDVSAIRDFIKMFYDRTGGVAPSWVLMFGDGTYDYKGITRPIDSEPVNFVPTYQSCDSWDPTDSYTSDDFFVMLEDNEGLWGENCGRDGDFAVQVNTIDVPIGRLPVINTQEAQDMVNKIIRYGTNPEGSGFGSWRNRVLLVADHKEGEGSIHVRQADGYTGIINSNDPCINLEKIYMDNYPMVTTGGITTFPEGRTALLNALDQGSLIVNYTGHGGEFAWSNARILENNDISKLANVDKLPAIITATCEFGRYDDPEKRSGAELMLLNPYAGAIALFTTVRLVYSSPNETLNRNYYREVFTFDSTRNRMPTIGEVMMRTKNRTFVLGSLNNINSRNFTLMGDPALTLNYPRNRAVITQINDQPVSVGVQDTLKSLAKVKITGEVQDEDGNLMSDFNGTMDVTVFDKPSQFTTRLSSFTFNWQKNRLFNGVATVVDGVFEFEFVVPIDISYDNGLGKISLYFSNDELDGSGCYTNLFVGGTDPNAILDDKGPEIQLFMNDENWQDGGITGRNPYLYAVVSDENGINTAGVGI